MRPDEPIEGAVGDRDALRPQPPRDLRQPQPVGPEPGLDGLPMRPECLLLIARRLDGGRARLVAHGGDLLVGRQRTPSRQAERRGGSHVLGDRLPVDASPSSDGAEAIAREPASEDFADLHHSQLPIGHLHLLSEAA